MARPPALPFPSGRVQNVLPRPRVSTCSHGIFLLPHPRHVLWGRGGGRGVGCVHTYIHTYMLNPEASCIIHQHTLFLSPSHFSAAVPHNITASRSFMSPCSSCPCPCSSGHVHLWPPNPWHAWTPCNRPIGILWAVVACAKVAKRKAQEEEEEEEEDTRSRARGQ